MEKENRSGSKMQTRRSILFSGAAFGAVGMLGACGDSATSKFRRYDGPPVTQVQVFKGERKMYLLSQDKVLSKYKIALGGNPVGHKQFEGDGKTPEGAYLIDRRNANSAFHLSLGISYPNENDRAFAEAMGKSPGGDIFIHGRARKDKGRGKDWTAGCIAVKDEEIEEIYAMVRDHTPIFIFA